MKDKYFTWWENKIEGHTTKQKRTNLIYKTLHSWDNAPDGEYWLANWHPAESEQLPFVTQAPIFPWPASPLNVMVIDATPQTCEGVHLPIFTVPSTKLSDGIVDFISLLQISWPSKDKC